MTTQFGLDLRLARRRAGYTQRDCAHLLAVHQSKLSAFERGKDLPSIEEICTLSLIYGRSFESLFAEIMVRARKQLRRRLKTMPRDTRAYAGTRYRARSLEKLQERLDEEDPNHD